MKKIYTSTFMGVPAGGISSGVRGTGSSGFPYQKFRFLESAQYVKISVEGRCSTP